MRSSDWSSGVGAADRRGGAADGGRALDALPQAGRTGDRQRGVRRQRVNTIANRITVARLPTATAEARSANPAPPRSRRQRTSSVIVPPAPPRAAPEIGRASGRERVCQYV